MRHAGIRAAVAAWLAMVAALVVTGCTAELLEQIREDVECATEPTNPVIEIYKGVDLVTDGSTISFGSQPQDSSTDITLSIKNAGTGNLLLQTPQVTPSSTTDGFSVQALSGTSVASGASVNLVLRFHPASGNPYAAAATIASNATNDASVSFDLTGTGVAPDTQAPTGSVSINAGAAYTTSASVTLTISATDTGGGTVTQMEVKNDNAFTGNWQPYATTLPWTLAGPDGTNTVYIRFRDGSGNASGPYSDTIILDTVNPTITSRTPASGASYVSRTTNITVNFSESMNQSTMTTSSVYLRLKGTTTPISATMTKAATSVTLDPTANLLYGCDYQIVVTSAITDLSGRALSNAGITEFTVERDCWEGPNGNESPATAFDLTDYNSYGETDIWIDFVPDIQYEEWSLPTGAHSKLALLEGYEYYNVTIPSGMAYLEIRLLFTQDETHGTTVDTSGTESITQYVNHDGYGMGGHISVSA